MQRGCVLLLTGNLLGLVLSPLLLQAFGWRSLFLIFGALGGPLLLMWNLCVPSVPRPELPSSQSAGFQRPAGGAYRDTAGVR
jgi:MFS family permease